MIRTTSITLLLFVFFTVGTMMGPRLIQNTHADEPQQIGVQERLASLERRVAALEQEVNRLSQANKATQAASAPAATEAAQAKAADGTSQAAAADNITITPINQVRRGQQVTLRGEVERIRDEDEFILRDSTGTIEIYIGWQNKMPVRVGDKVTVLGVADDDALPGTRPDIYARAIVLPDGTTQRMRLDE